MPLVTRVAHRATLGISPGPRSGLSPLMFPPGRRRTFRLALDEGRNSRSGGRGARRVRILRDAPRTEKTAAADSPDLRLELTVDDEPIVYCAGAGSESSARVRWRLPVTFPYHVVSRGRREPSRACRV